MIKFFNKRNPKDYKSKAVYIKLCKMDLVKFKNTVRSDFNIGKINKRDEYINSTNLIEWFNPSVKCSAIDIINTYINNLTCHFDDLSGKCYYSVNDYTRCPKSNTSIDLIMRVLEYGNDSVTPLYLLRKAFKKV